MTQDKRRIDEEAESVGRELSFFEKYLSVWVAVCIVAGVVLGRVVPAVPNTLGEFEYAHVNIPVAILIWFMIYPAMAEIDFKSILGVRERPRGLLVTWTSNWLIKPFVMYGLFWFFMTIVFDALISPSLQSQYLAGAVLLGAAPCTAMVFVWSYLSDGDAAYTLVQVATNDLILLFAYVPLVTFLLGIGGISVPYDTLILSVVLYVGIPLAAGYSSRTYLIGKKGREWFENVFLEKIGNLTIIGLLLTLILLFSFQGDIIVNNPLHILLIAIPLTVFTFTIFSIAYGWSYLWGLDHEIAAPAAEIGASNFFELAVAVAISVFGITSGAALATVVGVLVEVPVMLTLVAIANKTRKHF
ncbi:arsenic transporter [candidate division MSBL1 archaeon SCGC-AAA259A05]|uniref:Arsenic transporter n=1 Tax=candidate division MSBL1 archaeon SCGC-AAA259A05 TaxID=1698259 RepID=A0A133U668_9EURY|nr:arsenic transporter [candidate division MSBL1 archaeon SCGC-AAA259A05]